MSIFSQKPCHTFNTTIDTMFGSVQAGTAECDKLVTYEALIIVVPVLLLLFIYSIFPIIKYYIYGKKED